MGVRLREAMGSRSRGESGTVVGLDELLIQIGRVGDFPKEMHRELRKGNRKIGSMISKRIKPQVPRSKRVFNVRRSDGPDYDITPGTLRRSIGVRNSRGSRINVFVGPRAGGVAIKNDGWFAGIVESGHVGGRNRSIGSVNFNKIVPAIMRLRPIAERLMVIHMRQVFDKYKL
jgi:hypothetical protein